MKAYERLLKYVVVPTPSDEGSKTVPSTQRQFDLAHLLVAELKELGVTDAYVDDKCYVYGHIDATPGLESRSRLGFIAHMDTVSDFTDHKTVPVITENYDGKDLPLGDSGRVLSTENFKHLPSLKGRTLITTDGTTILGADNKAGIAEIMTMLERLTAENIPHGPICISFTPDEEIGTGPANFNIEAFGADFAFTVDGGQEGEIQYENFNACKASFKVHGFNVHPGTSKDTMINASLVAMEINSMLPACETPRGTEGYEGFYHLINMSGDVAFAKLEYAVRDLRQGCFDAKKHTLKLIEKTINEKWGADTAKLTITDQYRNMVEIIADCMHLIENAQKAAQTVGVTPLVIPIRGGTDGSQISFMGIPCPNLGTGGYAAHGPYEHVTVEGMDLVVDMILELIKLYAA